MIARLIASFLLALALFVALHGGVESRGFRVGMPQVVRLTNGNGFCSAFLIDPNTFLTARHCFSEGVSHPSIQFEDLSVAAVTSIVLGAEPGDDWALFTAPSGDVEPLSAQMMEPESGWAVSHVGYALGAPQHIRFGFLVHVAPMQLTAVGDAYPGSSGGPMLDAQGRVIGIVVRTKQPIPLFYAVPLSRVRSELKKRSVR